MRELMSSANFAICPEITALGWATTTGTADRGRTSLVVAADHTRRSRDEGRASEIAKRATTIDHGLPTMRGLPRCA